MANSQVQYRFMINTSRLRLQNSYVIPTRYLLNLRDSGLGATEWYKDGLGNTVLIIDGNGILGALGFMTWGTLRFVVLIYVIDHRPPHSC
jgi:hypothetical protein